MKLLAILFLALASHACTEARSEIVPGGTGTAASFPSGISNTGTTSPIGIVAAAYYAGSANCIWTRTSTTLGRTTNDDADCSSIVVEQSSISVTASTGDFPQISFASLPAGKYEVHAMFRETHSNTGAVIGYAISDAACASNFVGRGYAASTTSADQTNPHLLATFNYASAAARAFEICCFGQAGTCNVANDTNTANADDRTQFVVVRYPL